MVHFKHKTYKNVSGKSPEILMKKVEAYLIKQKKLDVFYSCEEEGELFIGARPKHDIANRIIGLNYSVGCGIIKENGEIKVRVGDPCLVLGTGLFGQIKVQEVFRDLWAIIDSYLS